MRWSEGFGQTNAARSGRGALTVVLSALALTAGAGPASAHDGDTAMIHSCIVPSSGHVQIIEPDETCSRTHRAQDWPAVDATTTYSAGPGLSLSGNEFSVTGAPWDGLTDVPAGFADGVDDVGSMRWSDLTGVPTDLLDGDDDGSAALTQLRSRLATGDGTPDEDGDLVSFTRIKDLSSPAGGRILGSFIQDGTIDGQDVANGAILAADLAGRDTDGMDSIPGAVTSEKIFDGTIQGRDLGPVVTVVAQNVDPLTIEPGARAAVTIPVPGVRANDLVTVSPPATLEQAVIFAGSDGLLDGQVTVYLHNATAEAVDPSARIWKVRWLDTRG